MTNLPAIELRDVTVVYNNGSPNEVIALKKVSFSVAKGETIVIIGGNGSGKSTLLKAIAGFAPVKSGKVFLNGRDVTNWPSYRRFREIRYAHQDPMLGTSPNLTVHENFQLSIDRPWWLPTPIEFGIGEDQVQSIRNTGLPLEEKVATPVNMLSVGQRQAIALCLALSTRHSILLLDEFTASLDESTTELALKFTQDEVERLGCTLILVMHDLKRVKSLNKKTFIMLNGELKCQPQIFNL